MTRVDEASDDQGTGVLEDFAGWYGREYPKVLATVALVGGDLDLAEDVTAEAFARALERWDRVRQMASPGGWVATVALNRLKRRRRRSRFERFVVRARRPEPVPPPPDRDPELWEAVRALPPRMRQAVALRYIADLTEPQVADAMGVSRGTVASTLHDARERLSERLTSGLEARDG